MTTPTPRTAQYRKVHVLTNLKPDRNGGTTVLLTGFENPNALKRELDLYRMSNPQFHYVGLVEVPVELYNAELQEYVERTYANWKPAPVTTYTIEYVRAAANRAAEDILDAIDAPDEGHRDLVNLVVNATLQYLSENTGTTTLTDVVAENYDGDVTLDDVIRWINS